MLKLVLFIILAVSSTAQKQISITIDDIPDTKNFERYGKSLLLDALDSLNIPIAIFINENKIDTSKITHIQLLTDWLERDYVTAGNHTFSHKRYSNTDFELYKKEILNGQKLTTKITGKAVKHFRFPYNDLGKDSLQQTMIRNFLVEHNLKLSPFTIESSDWMYNYLYKHYLSENDSVKAAFIGNQYVEKTVEYVNYFESITLKEYNRSVKHIYLCHDNLINSHYLAQIVNRLKQHSYQFIAYENALSDPIYKQENLYYKKWGISWIYRWITDKKKRSKLMKSEPDIMPTYNDFKRVETLIQKENK